MKAKFLQAQKLNFYEKATHCQAQQQCKLLVPFPDFVPSGVGQQPVIEGHIQETEGCWALRS